MSRSVQRISHLTLHRQFFAEIAAGTKRIEYRSQTMYWKRRLEGREYDAILFRNGYSRIAPEMLVEFLRPPSLWERAQGLLRNSAWTHY